MEDLAYNQSFYGYSAAGHPHGELLAHYLQLFVHSQTWLHYALLTSAKAGAQRPNLYKEDLDECPIIPFDLLTDAQRAEVNRLSKRLIGEEKSVFTVIDAFFGKLYGLDERDMQVVRDTLEVRDPNDELGQRGSTPPTAGEIEKFRRRLESGLRPFFKVLGKPPEAELWNPAADGKSQGNIFWHFSHF